MKPSGSLAFHHRKRICKIWCSILLAASALFVPGCDGSRGAPATKDMEETVQNLITDDCMESFTVAILYREQTEFLNREEHNLSIDNLVLDVRYHGSGRRLIPFTQQFKGTWKRRNALTPWTGGLAQTGFTLPSGRVLIDKSTGEVLFILFDGDKMQLFSLDKGSMKFVPTDPKRVAPLLKTFYMKAFDPNDACWSYAVVKHATFFGFSTNDRLEPSGDIDVSQLFKQWNEVKPSP